MASKNKLQGSNPLNNPEYYNRQGYNTFDLSRTVGQTARFGELTPFFFYRSVYGDKLKMHVSHDIQNYLTFQSPLLGNIRYHRDFFAVPRRALLPHTYERLTVNPNKGSDVPDDAYPVFDLAGFVGDLLTACFGDITSTDKRQLDAVWWNKFVLLYCLCGYGTLLDNLDCRVASFAGTNSKLTDSSFVYYRLSFGYFLDTWFSNMIEKYPDGFAFRFTDSSTASSDVSLHFNITSPYDFRRMMFTLIDSDKPFYLVEAHTDLKMVDFYEFQPYATLYNADKHIEHIDVLPFAAYQTVCAQFYTNSNVDYVFDYKLWMQNMESLARLASLNSASTANLVYPVFFPYNGLEIQYDVFSNKVLSRLGIICSSAIHDVDDVTEAPDTFIAAYMFFMNLFAPRNTLRFSDYFRGSRVSPLAVGDVSAPVVGNKVSAVDTTKSISMQRFLNAVNRTEQLLPDYIRSIFGVEVQEDPETPKLITSQVWTLGDSVNVNTADDQGSRKANLFDKGDKFAFDLYVPEDSYLIGLGSFDCMYMYPFTTDRMYFHENRFDDFQPMLQDIGDQAVMVSELNSSVSDSDTLPDDAMSYQVQDAEYKFAVPTVHGGLINHLPSWSLVDYETFLYNKIGPRFIRHLQTELDKYFSGLSNVSLEGYFHFIIKYDISLSANRKMKSRPGILE